MSEKKYRTVVALDGSIGPSAVIIFESESAQRAWDYAEYFVGKQMSEHNLFVAVKGVEDDYPTFYRKGMVAGVGVKEFDIED